MTKKQILRCVAFLVVVCVMLVSLCDLFETRNNTNFAKRFVAFRALPKNTIDAVLIGTSGIDRYWNPAKAYEESGITVFPYASDAMPSWLFIDVIEEIYTYQSPKLLVLDIRSFTQSNSNIPRVEARARKVIDSMEFFSLNRIKTAASSVKWMEKITGERHESRLSFYLSFIKYHTEWSGDEFFFEENIGEKQHEYLGFFMNERMTAVKRKQKAVPYDSEYFEKLDPFAEESLYELFDYIEKQDLEVIFLDTPKFLDKVELGRTNTIIKILEENNMNYICYNTTNAQGTFDKIELDYSNDFYNSGHVNFYGSEKFTDTFADYLNENYTFADHRNDEKVKKHWDGVYEKICKKVKEYEKNLQS